MGPMRRNRFTRCVAHGFRRSALLALIPAGLAPLVVACVDDDLTEAPMPPAAETGLAADGHPLADGGWEPKTEEADTTTAVLEHPADDRVRLTISTTSPLRPNVAVELTIEGVAREAIDSGEVVLALPTRAIMDHALDTGVPEVPAKARWDLPAMAKGGTWSETFTVPGEAAGYYGVLVNAYTHGPNGGPWLFDDVSRSAWMFVSETDGQLTRLFEDSLFPEGIHPVPGPATAIGARPGDPDRTTPNWHRDSVFVQVLYYNSWRDGFKPAVGMELYAYEYREPDGRIRRNPQSTIVPEDGIVAFGCPPEGWYLEGKGNLPETRYVTSRSWVIAYWWADRSDCGRLKTFRKKAPYRKKPKIEGHVAALLHDLTDDESESGDFTEYSGVYVAMIFKTCKTRSKYWKIKKWWKRTNVSNIVWCLENQIDKPVHEDVFPYIRTPVDVKHKAKEYEPEDWDILDIRTVWLKNLKSH